MKIEIEPQMVPPREFVDLCRELVEQGKKFDKQTLAHIPYAQLLLCCIGNAGKAACSIQLVQQEKKNRRERFLNMELEEFKAVENYLKIEQMYDDVLYAISHRNAVKWETLSECQKIWAKLTCLYTHVDNPTYRIEELIEMFKKCETIPSDVCKNYAFKLQSLGAVAKLKPPSESFRRKIIEMAETLLGFMSIAERTAMESEQIQEFSCTSDCFRITDSLPGS